MSYSTPGEMRKKRKILISIDWIWRKGKETPGKREVNSVKFVNETMRSHLLIERTEVRLKVIMILSSNTWRCENEARLLLMWSCDQNKNDVTGRFLNTFLTNYNFKNHKMKNNRQQRAIILVKLRHLTLCF